MVYRFRDKKIGTPVKAMADGDYRHRRYRCTMWPCFIFGRFITIKYDNGLSSTFGL